MESSCAYNLDVCKKFKGMNLEVYLFAFPLCLFDWQAPGLYGCVLVCDGFPLVVERSRRIKIVNIFEVYYSETEKCDICIQKEKVLSEFPECLWPLVSLFHLHMLHFVFSLFPSWIVEFWDVCKIILSFLLKFYDAEVTSAEYKFYQQTFSCVKYSDALHFRRYGVSTLNWISWECWGDPKHTSCMY